MRRGKKFSRGGSVAQSDRRPKRCGQFARSAGPAPRSFPERGAGGREQFTVEICLLPSNVGCPRASIPVLSPPGKSNARSGLRAHNRGRPFADGLVVMTYVEGGPPETEADWRCVADTLRRLHRLTQGWPQRPGWRAWRANATVLGELIVAIASDILRHRRRNFVY